MTGIALDDRGFTLGHGLFETVLFADGALVAWEAHLDRLIRGCPVLGLPTPDLEACQRAAEYALAAVGAPPRAAVRLNWSAGSGGRGLEPPAELRPQLTATAAPVTASDTPVSLSVAQVRRNAASLVSRLKTLSYLDNVLARVEARAAGADEALMLNTDGHVACAAPANVFWIKGGVVRTPALECGVLDGIVRAQVLVACARLSVPTVEVQAPLADLRGAAIFVTNSLVGVRPVSRLDGEPVIHSPLVDVIAKTI